MKKQSLSNTGTSVRNIFLAILFMMGMASSAHAQDTNKTGPGSIEIKYLGTMDDQPLFLLEFDNSKQEHITISITSEDGTLLYGEKFREKKFSRKFKFEKSGMDPFKLKFTLTSDSDKQSQVFEVNTKVFLVQDVVVTKLK